MFAREMEKKCQISGGGSFPGASIAGSAVAELGVNKETQHRMHFSQMRQNAKFGTIALPGAFAHFDELQALVDESAMKAMLRATSPDVAKLAVDSFGSYNRQSCARSRVGVVAKSLDAVTIELLILTQRVGQSMVRRAG